MLKQKKKNPEGSLRASSRESFQESWIELSFENEIAKKMIRFQPVEFWQTASIPKDSPKNPFKNPPKNPSKNLIENPSENPYKNL